MSRLGIVITCLLAALLQTGLLTSTALCGSTPPSTTTKKPSQKSPEEIEYGVKAAFIFNFMKFVEWPAEKKARQDRQGEKPAPMVIGILGDNPFGKAFDPILDKSIHERTIRIVPIPSYEAFLKKSTDRQNAQSIYAQQYQKTIQQCDILFICASEKEHLAAIFSLSQNHAVLTISDLEHFAQKGGMIGFVKEKNKIRFEINLKTANRDKIKIRSQLLSLARKVYKDQE